MKKYLLGLLAISLGLISFSNAETINVSCTSMNECTPSTLNISPDVCVNGYTQMILSNYSCENVDEYDTSCGLSFDGEDGSMINLLYENGELIANDCRFEGTSNTFYVNVITDASFEGTLNNLILDNGGGNEGGNQGGNEGGNEGGNTGGSSDSDLVSSLSPVITGLSNTMLEFIPYIVYIGLGVLGVIIGFVAIRWLINWVKRQSFSVFSSRRKK